MVQGFGDKVHHSVGLEGSVVPSEVRYDWIPGEFVCHMKREHWTSVTLYVSASATASFLRDLIRGLKQKGVGPPEKELLFNSWAV